MESVLLVVGHPWANSWKTSRRAPKDELLGAKSHQGYWKSERCMLGNLSIVAYPLTDSAESQPDSLLTVKVEAKTLHTTTEA